MIGFLRFVGLMNTAVWFGTAFFFVLAAEPAFSSGTMLSLIGSNNFPFYSIAIADILTSRFLTVYLVCATLGVLHMAAEWLYLGKYPRKFWLGLLAALCVLGLAQGTIVQPLVRESHQARFQKNAPAEQRQAAAAAFRAWHLGGAGLNYAIVLGLALYLWHVSNPSDPMRFVSARQFRS